MASINKGVSIFLAVQFIKLITTPFTDWKAYKLGLIDDKGNKIKDASTTVEKKEFNSFNNLVRNLKKLLAKLPGGATKIGSAIAGIKLLKEEFGLDEKLAIDMLEEAWNIDSKYETDVEYGKWLFDSIYNVRNDISAINITEAQTEIINIQNHKITKLTTDGRIHYLP